MLVKIELAFKTTEDENADAFGDRIREAVGEESFAMLDRVLND